MNLCIDIGNTRTKLAVFDKDQLVHKEVWDSLQLDALQTLAYNQKVKKNILSSVANVPEEVENFLKHNFFYLQLTTETPLPIAIHYKTPHSLGKDRIAAAAGAFGLFPGKNCLVIDAGTCITADILNAAGAFLGGNISPGLTMRLKAMHHFTARLPLVKRDLEIEGGTQITHHQSPITNILGQSTEHAIWNGGMLGAVWELEGFIRQCKQHFKPLQVILTGGDAKIFAHPNLVLLGLNKILQHNAKEFEGF
jgi:type III pantothenate kinase